MTMGRAALHHRPAASPLPVSLDAAGAPPASAVDAATVPSRLTCNGRPFAIPAYRILLYFDVTLAEPRMRDATAAIIETFAAAARARLAWMMFADEPVKLKAVPFGPESVGQANDWFRGSELGFGASLCLHGPMDDDLQAPTVPHLRIEQNRVTMMEICLPPETDLRALVAFSDTVLSTLGPVAPLCGLMAYGFYVPNMLIAMDRALPIAHQRYRAATEAQIGGPIIGMKRPNSKGVKPWSLHPDLEPGIADIGWRTIIGRPFLDRLPDLASADLPDTIHVTGTPDYAVVQAGPAPIWGDVNAGEDISAYAAVAELLRPVQAPIEISARTLFGSKTDDPDGRDRLEDYVARHASEAQT